MTGDRLPDAEVVARFIMFRDWVRADGTVKPDAFMPPGNLALSVSAHGSREERALWDRGDVVARLRERQLLGRADVAVGVLRADARPLDAVSAPLPEDPWHCHVVGWPPPSQKPLQKHLAQRVAARAVFLRVPG